ncbi:hypothetical protein SEN110799_28360 [Salmonella enterica subsp. enterica serovar Kentucky]|nr:hypothetical protein SEESL791_003600 [Salmonella enterica subsp. enterica serovar Sloterdijk str. ATCC 15791]ESG85820.1 hypothetical protein SEEK9263_09362 [Salmonella enterica subsp. enterica serovar Kentucky str. ATCC 9263]KUD20691.1 hypothetical protein DE82_01980 [Salmonella enterica subsp. enterica serovar Kentucky]ODL70867.1 hypothetical protein BFG45_01820 [Salmonella enterica]KUD75195.1 hypothetical protein DE93_09930 [Salmonella enterica subsp. enterica serovar Kentucky]
MYIRRPHAVALLDAHWHQRRADTRYQQLTRGIALFAGFCKRNLRIGAESQTIFFTAEAIAEIP